MVVIYVNVSDSLLPSSVSQSYDDKNDDGDDGKLAKLIGNNIYYPKDLTRRM